MDDTMPAVKEKRTISRRAVIVNGAVGAAAFWSVPIIESVTQRAAAQSGCEEVSTGQISYIWIVFTYLGTTYFAGYGPPAWQQGDLKVGGKNTTNPVCTSPCGPWCTSGAKVNGQTLTSGGITGPGSPTYAPGTNGTDPDLQIGGVTVLSFNNGTISPGTGVVIVAWFSFAGDLLTPACPSTPGIPPCGISIG